MLISNQSIPKNKAIDIYTAPEINNQCQTGAGSNYAGKAPSADQSFDIFKIFSTLYHRKWTVLLATVLFALLALLISSFIKPSYRASTTLEIARKPYEIVEFGQISTTNGDDNKFYNTQYGLLKSPALASQVIKELNLTPAQLTLSNQVESDKILKKKTIEELFISNLTVNPIPDSQLVTVSYENTDPQLASLITNTIAKSFIQSNIEKKRNINTYTREYLSNRVDEAKRKLEASEILLDNYASKHQIIKVDETQTAKLSALQTLESMLAEADAVRIDAESENKYTRANGNGIENVINNPVIQMLKQQKAQLVAEYQENLQTFKPSYPGMLQLQNRIKQLSREISAERTNIIANTRISAGNRYKASQEKVKKLNTKVVELKGDLIKLQNKTVEYNNIKREVASNQELYNTLLRRLNEVTVAGDAAVNNISIINQAAAPKKKIRPRRALNTAAGVLLGLFVGSLMALLLEVTRGRIRDEKDLEQLTNLPVLGKIPKSKLHFNREAPLAIYSTNSSVLAEAMRSLRTNLTYASGHPSPRSILITSPSPGEGKSTVAINLACAYALMGKSVLLIDADMRSPSIGKQFFKKTSRVGLSEFLKNQAKIVEITKATRVPQLYVISAGKIPDDPVELLASKKMETLIKLAREKFDVVIVDSPPMLDISDPVVLSKFVDATLLTVKINQTHINDMSHAIDRLEHVYSNLLGVVATHTKQKYRYYGQEAKVPAVANI